MPGEFDLIGRIRRAGAAPGVVLGIGDDAALLRPTRGQLLAACVDTLVEGIHFPPGTAWAAIGWKALAVNLSDLAAMGAKPRWATLALTLPRERTAGFVPLVAGLRRLARHHGVTLVGGDTTRGPLAACVQALGEVPQRVALRRDAARVGDAIVVSGQFGDAAAGLAIVQGRLRDVAARDAAVLRRRLHRPQPRVALGLALRGIARACIDVSDGLAQDLGHLLRSSAVGAQIDAAAVPCSPALCRAVADPAARAVLALTGGDDYELCFTVPPSALPRLAALTRRLRLPLTRIGTIIARRGLRVRSLDGSRMALSRRGFDHFA